MAVIESSTELNKLLESWKELPNGTDPVPILTRISEIIEKETETYFKMDPDPFDERHPSRARPECTLGFLLKTIFKNDEFMSKLVTHYVFDNASSGTSSNTELQTAASRLMIDILPGLETSVVFSDTPTLVHRLFERAEKGEEPLKSYSIALLAAAMEVQDIAITYKEQNMQLVPLLLRRLKQLSQEGPTQPSMTTDGCWSIGNNNNPEFERPFSVFKRMAAPNRSPDAKRFNHENYNNYQQNLLSGTSSSTANNSTTTNTSVNHHHNHGHGQQQSEQSFVSSASLSNGANNNNTNSNPTTTTANISMMNVSPVSKRRRISSPVSPCGSSASSTAAVNYRATESNSSWAEIEPLMIGSVQLYPLTNEMKQRFILQYLTPMGDYQELLYHIFEEDALGLILHYIDLNENRDVRLAFESLKYLASLLCHKKFALEFLNREGLQKLLSVYRPSVAATGVSICLYYLAYSEDAMERICLLPKNVLKELVSYCLWLLECSHDSSRCHATMFFSLTFAFRVILELFDGQDGLRKLLNVTFLLDIFTDDDDRYTEDELIQKRQTARHVCVALKRYFEAHLIIESESLRRSTSSMSGTSTTSSSINSTSTLLSTFRSSSPSCNQVSVPPYKAARFSNDIIHHHVEQLLEVMPMKLNWRPVDDFVKLGGFKLLISLISASEGWSFNGKSDAVKSALDVLVIASVVPKFQLLFNELVTNEDGHQVPAMAVILESLEGEKLLSDPEVVKSALHVIINCVCGPVSRIGSSFARLATNSSTASGQQTPTLTTASSKKKGGAKTGEEILTKMWKSVKDNDGVPILLNLLLINTPITEADAIRALACQALCGLSRHDDVRQIIGKRPIFSNGTLQSLMKEPVLQDKRSEHVKFCKFCMELIYRVTGQSSSTLSHSQTAASFETCVITPDSLNKAEVVAQTKIIYNEKELLELIHHHLVNKGYHETASVLQKEAGLPFSTPRLTPSPWPSKTPVKSVSMSSRNVNNLLLRSQSVGHGDAVMAIKSNSCINGSVLSQQQQQQSASDGNKINTISNQLASQSMASSSLASVSTGSGHSVAPSTPPSSYLRSSFNRQRHKSSATMSKEKLLMKSCPALQKSSVSGSTGYQPSPVLKKLNEATNQVNKSVTLDSIVTEYLRKQHALCKNPIVTCPPFDLFKPHRCPEPSNSNFAPANMASRIQRRQLCPPTGGMFGSKLTRKLIYSKFKPLKTFKDADGVSNFTTCAFSHVDQFLFLGTVSGEMATFNLDTGSLVATYSCHEADITHIEPSRDGKSIITCSIWRQPVSALWSFTDVFDIKMSFDEDFHVEFGKLCPQDKAIGTRNSTANLYDLIVGRKVMTFIDETKSNKYIKNQATFNYTDELVLNDGILWDVRSGSHVHKFDKFNKTINGVFHPNGTEIIANAEVWDLRTYHLLKTVPALDQCRIKFNSTGDVIYGTMFEEEMSEDDVHRSPYGSSFRTFDSFDYTNIATIDIKKTIYDLAVDPGDNFIAVVENVSSREAARYESTESVCRLYEVGRNKEADEEVDEEEEEEDEDDDEDGDDDSDDDDDDDEDMIGTSDIRNEDGGPFVNSDDDDEDGDDNDDDDDDVLDIDDTDTDEYEDISDSDSDGHHFDGGDDDGHDEFGIIEI